MHSIYLQRYRLSPLGVSRVPLRSTGIKYFIKQEEAPQGKPSGKAHRHSGGWPHTCTQVHTEESTPAEGGVVSTAPRTGFALNLGIKELNNWPTGTTLVLLGGWGGMSMRFKGRGGVVLKTWTNQICSLKAPWAAVVAAVAAAVWTVLLDMTPVANSCWAFSKLAPVVRYRAWIWGGGATRGDEHREHCIDPTGLDLLSLSPTFLNMMRDMTAREVKRAATRIMMMPTGMLVFKPISAEIQPLRKHHFCSTSIFPLIYPKRKTNLHIQYFQDCQTSSPQSFWRYEKHFSLTERNPTAYHANCAKCRSITLSNINYPKKHIAKNAYRYHANNANIPNVSIL